MYTISKERTMPKAKEEDFLPLRDSVYNKLRQAILTGEYPPGERLMEVHLGDKLGVSRTPIREAIRMLELEGLVTMIPRKGSMVSQITEKNMSDVLEVRRALDILCVQLACERITSDGIAELKRARDNFEKAVATNDNRIIAQADVEFHNVIIRATGNDRLISLEDSLSLPMYRYRYEYIKDSSGHDNLVKEHRKIVNAIEKRNPEAAASEAGEHIDNQRRSIIRQIRLEREEETMNALYGKRTIR